jgi:hypothetical protein
LQGPAEHWVVIVQVFTRITLQAVGCVLCFDAKANAALLLLLLLLLLQGIKEHPWYTAELPPFLQQALDDLQLEQVRLLCFYNITPCYVICHNITLLSSSCRTVVVRAILNQAPDDLQLE